MGAFLSPLSQVIRRSWARIPPDAYWGREINLRFCHKAMWYAMPASSSRTEAQAICRTSKNTWFDKHEREDKPWRPHWNIQDSYCGQFNVCAYKFFDRSWDSSTGGHQLKLKIRRSQTKIRIIFSQTELLHLGISFHKTLYCPKPQMNSRTGWMNSGLKRRYPLFSK